MRRVVGRQVVDLSAADFDALRDGRPALLDVGTGDGRHVVRTARARPDWLVVGLDANRDQMRRASSAAAGKPAKGGLPNAVFVWASVEQLPDELHDFHELHVLMPWGSLLRGMIGLEPGVPERLRAAAAPGARMHVLLNLHAWRPPVPEVGTTAEPDPDWARTHLAGIYGERGWHLDGAGYAGAGGAGGLSTSWARRLGSSRERLDILELTATATGTATG